MSVPKDPFMLLSWTNMKLRDSYSSLEELGYGENIRPEEILNTLKAAGYRYSEETNSFISGT